MQCKVIMLRGLPGSGKSTWAKQYLIDHPGSVRVSKDDLRAMLHNGYHSKRREKFVLQARDAIIATALDAGHDCVIDDTNYWAGHLKRIESIADLYDAIVEIKDFSDVDVDVCVERDRQRENQVGDKVIRDMARKYVATKPPKIERDPALRDAIICDLDGTLALFGDANPYDRDFGEDKINESVKGILDLYYEYLNIIFLSGRKEKHRAQTEQWLRSHGFIHVELRMRRDGDNRKDVIVKEELYDEHIKGRYNVRAVFDDRLQVCRLWYSLGLPLFRVGDPDADF